MAFPKNLANLVSLGHTRAIIMSPLLNLPVKWEGVSTKEPREVELKLELI